MHGTWDKGNQWTGNFLNAHTNLTEIDLALELLAVIRADAVDMVLELACLLELHHVALALERTASGEENVLVVPVHVLDPIREPGDRLVVHDLLPLARHVGLGDRDALADVDGNVLRVNSELRRGSANGTR